MINILLWTYWLMNGPFHNTSLCLVGKQSEFQNVFFASFISFFYIYDGCLTHGCVCFLVRWFSLLWLRNLSSTPVRFMPNGTPQKLGLYCYSIYRVKPLLDPLMSLWANVCVWEIERERVRERTSRFTVFHILVLIFRCQSRKNQFLCSKEFFKFFHEEFIKLKMISGNWKWEIFVG